MQDETIYHIYAKDRCLYPCLDEKEFNVKWAELKAMVGLMRTDYTEEDLNKLGLPDKELISECNQIEVDAVLDLNQDFSPISATLCAEIIAPIKLGFYSAQGEDYYNVMVRRTGEELAESGFKEIFQIIGIG